MPDYTITRDVVAAAALAHGEELKLYYIGNCTPSYDDRSWAISIESRRDPKNRNHFAPHNIVLGSTEEMEKLTAAELAADITYHIRKLDSMGVPRNAPKTCERCGTKCEWPTPWYTNKERGWTLCEDCYDLVPADLTALAAREKTGAEFAAEWQNWLARSAEYGPFLSPNGSGGRSV